MVETPTAHDEAEAIALMLRSAIETPGKTAALVTPDRVLARRVAARLKRYDLAIDDSAGVPVARTVPGAFLDLVLGAVETDFAPPELMALLKHPLALLGRRPEEARGAARALERGVFRDIYVGQGLAGARAALEATRSDRKRGPLALSPEHHAAAHSLVQDLETAFAPLTALAGPLPHDRVASRQSPCRRGRGPGARRDGSTSGLWQGDAGEALSVLLAELIDAGHGLSLTAADYPPFYRSLVAGEVVRPRAALHPRLFIWGPLEARLQQPDMVILGSLNEGVWPRHQEAGPWLSRPMRETLGLNPPERRIGLSAHDFAQALGASQVYLTRALKVDGVPTVPSRWLQRLLALVKAAGLEAKIEPEQPWVAWARERDTRPRSSRSSRPSQGRRSRPGRRKLSVTRIERWIANPYEIFARHILTLEPMKQLGAEPDAALRGTIVHRALHEFSGAFPDALPADTEAKLIAIANGHFDRLGGSPIVEAFWRPAFRRFARWFAATEPERRDRRRAHPDRGPAARSISAPASPSPRAPTASTSPRTARSVIYDYKTGKPPVQKHVDELYAPQLPLEAAIAAAGGFADLGKRPSAGSSISAPRAATTAAKRAMRQRPRRRPCREALAKLTRLIARYADPDDALRGEAPAGPVRQRLSLRRLRAARARQGMAHARGRGGVPMSAPAPSARSRCQPGARLRSRPLGLGVGQCRHGQDRGAGQAVLAAAARRVPSPNPFSA